MAPRLAPPPPESRAPAAAFVDALLTLVLGFALVARFVGLGAPLDRQFDGFQGAFFTLAAIGYERFDPHPAWPYPLVHVDAPDDLVEHGYVYANHPPLVPLLVHAALFLAGPAGWQDAWREGRPPERFEAPLRAPFAAAQALAAMLLALALALIGARRQGLAAAALFLTLPGTLVYSGLVNYENPGLLALAGLVAAFAFAVRRGGAGGAVSIALVASGCFAGAVTYAPLLFLPPLALWLVLRLGKRALAPLFAVGAGAAVALVAHAVLARAALERLEREPAGLATRAAELLAPLTDGSLPLSRWLAVQVRVLLDHGGWIVPALAVVALVFAAARRGARAAPAPLDTGLGAALLAGGALVQLAFYRHTGDPQEPFALWWAPGLAVTAAALVARLAEARRPLAAAVLVAGAALAGFAGARALAAPWRDVEPRRPGPAELGADLAALAPPGSVVWYPDALGLTPAVGLYAWRTLVPVAPPDYALPVVRAASVGLGAAPAYFAEPLTRGMDLARPVQAAADHMLADLARHRPDVAPVAEGEYFRLWRLE